MRLILLISAFLAATAYATHGQRRRQIDGTRMSGALRGVLPGLLQ
jgi:hypothetical protein